MRPHGCGCAVSASIEMVQTKSTSRYQYLELAYYIVHGRCQDPKDPGDDGFILNLYTYKTIDDFLQRSPKAISRDTQEVYAKEFVFGSRVSMQHGYTKEDRAFVYIDQKVRASIAWLCSSSAAHLSFCVSGLRMPSCLRCLRRCMATSKELPGFGW